MSINKEILKNINILYAEDEDDVRDFTTRTLLGLANNVQSAPNGLIGYEKFKENFEDPTALKFDIIVTDINMPKMGGLEMCAKIREFDTTTPIIITTAHNDSNFLTQAIKLGVRGYSMKPVDLRQLIENIIIAVEPGILRKELENKVKERTLELEKVVAKLELHTEELLYEATHDSLTSLYNRQKINKDLVLETQRCLRYKNNLSIIMLDIDYFKNINDTYGHDVGDEVLISLAKLSKKQVRPTDTLARWGGEEFMILLPETAIDDALIVAEKLRENIEKSILTTNKSINITTSFGVADFKEKDTIATFLKRVDEALYEAKDTGRNKVVKR